MKKLFTLLLVGALTLVSCSKDDNTQDEGPAASSLNFFQNNSGDWTGSLSGTGIDGSARIALDVGSDSTEGLVDIYVSADGSCYVYASSLSVQLNDPIIQTNTANRLVVSQGSARNSYTRSGNRITFTESDGNGNNFSGSVVRAGFNECSSSKVNSDEDSKLINKLINLLN